MSWKSCWFTKHLPSYGVSTSYASSYLSIVSHVWLYRLPCGASNIDVRTGQISVSYYEERPEHWLPPNDSGRWYLTDIFTVNKYVADNCRVRYTHGRRSSPYTKLRLQKELEGINYERSFSSLKYRIEPLRFPLARSLSDSLTGTSSHLSVATSDTVTDMPSSSEGTSERAYPTIIELIDHDHQFQSVGLLRALYGPGKESLHALWTITNRK